ncbi:hypothetical protein SERLADRAFT_443791 [Serpula lacrymans var. lacrymans S7.9]|uniref:Uncharacterized protein n=1 Tax=Serpula lacrymans var. lacrymans (strain S7.9) TaxID=578457 RepID=F8PDK1_SERL9|nr:uncharacterized protein SERLADRAFT_443791 [Serpula lacrymans var. lacrymans S7.9]EGO18822.1 hypothetical protein SERLADRAFT_443791 [Serpula lacrymans var. lacrymans S7.9]
MLHQMVTVPTEYLFHEAIKKKSYTNLVEARQKAEVVGQEADLQESLRNFVRQQCNGATPIHGKWMPLRPLLWNSTAPLLLDLERLWLMLCRPSYRSSALTINEVLAYHIFVSMMGS